MRQIFCIIIFVAIASSATCKEFFKYTDQNGIAYWLDENSNKPHPIPIMYKYEDKNGIPFWVDAESKIPDEYRKNTTPNKETVDKPKSVSEQIPVDKPLYSTRISIVNNVIIVPVLFRNKGRKVKARMILDTGASVTTLYASLASQLHLNKNKLTKTMSINANGVSSDSLLTKVDHIEVDNKILANAEVVVIPSHSNIGADGLLGNSFLRFFNFTIDYEKQLLRWN
jgi:hypothetical protein